jgi:D-beta-D-heptose 7-phosphate kinase/D-beta-D-heptose 1-phosphate adenosyltransferase
MKRIAIIGESCRDVFVYCDAHRLCPEAPVPVLNVVEQRENAGMASNVLRNMEKIGETESGNGFIELHTNPNWKEITKTRYVHHKTNHMFFRVDTTQSINPYDHESFDLSDFDAIVISDYNKGFLSEQAIEYICDRYPNVFIDTKKILGPWVKNAKFIKINDYEYQNSKPFITPDFENKIIHTMGELGCEYNGRRYPTTPVEIKDVSGAGDTFMAAFVIAYVHTGNVHENIKFANQCATKVVAQKGVGTI